MVLHTEEYSCILSAHVLGVLIGTIQKYNMVTIVGKFPICLENLFSWSYEIYFRRKPMTKTMRYKG